jgi:FixJ family two-component response regulator
MSHDCETATVFVIDDDAAMRKSLQWLIESVSGRVRTFENAQSFLDEYQADEPGCLVLDVRMPGMSGLELQEKLVSRGITIPVIFITAHGDVPMAVRAMHLGAVDFVEKPFNDQLILDRIQQALNTDASNRQQLSKKTQLYARYEHLTPRERTVMQLVTTGKANKQIASELKLSAKTVETHRARVMEKMQADSIAELVRMAVCLDVN